VSTETDQLTDAEVAAVRRLLDTGAIQEVMLRYCRSADRNDPELMKTIFWEEGTDNHGMYSGSARGFFERAYANRDLLSARYHLISAPRVEFVDESLAKVETYFHYAGVWVADGSETLASCGGRYRDVFERRGDEWRVLRRLTIYDWSLAAPYEPGWDFFGIPEGVNRGAVEPTDATYAAAW
jgi:SnoaL-like domain